MADSEEVFTRHMLTAEYNEDGQLQIVKVEPFNHYQVEEGSSAESPITDLTSGSEVNEAQYILDPKKGPVQLDLMNLTLVRYEDGHESYRLVSNDEDEGGSQEILCVMQTSDNEENEGLETYAVVDNEVSESVVMLSEDMQESVPVENQMPSNTEASQPQQKTQKLEMTSAQLLAKAKAYQRAKAQLIRCHSQPGKRGRKRKTELPPQPDLLSSSNFKLYLYSCKMCNFKCNIVKELTAHKATEHGGASGGRGSLSRSQHALQCARCPYKATLQTQLVKHVQEKHNLLVEAQMVEMPKVTDAPALICDKCGFESRDSVQLNTHTLLAHGGQNS